MTNLERAQELRKKKEAIEKDRIVLESKKDMLLSQRKEILDKLKEYNLTEETLPQAIEDLNNKLDKALTKYEKELEVSQHDDTSL